MKKVFSILFFVVFVVCLLTACNNVELSLTFDANGGEFENGEETIVVTTNGASKVSVPKNPTKDGYTFAGWFWDKDVLDKEFTENSLKGSPIHSDITVYAKWISIEESTGFRINPYLSGCELLSYVEPDIPNFQLGILDLSLIPNLIGEDINVLKINKSFFELLPSSVEKVIIPSSVSSIEFGDCKGVEIEIKSNLFYCSQTIECLLDNHQIKYTAIYNKNKTRLIRYIPIEGDTYYLPPELRTIAENAFSNLTELKKISTDINIYNSLIDQSNQQTVYQLEKIEDKAFQGCEQLFSLNFSVLENLERIGNYAFVGCKDLDNIDLSALSSLSIIENGVFAGCEGLMSITLPDNLDELGDYVFYGCIHLNSINIDMGNDNYMSIEGVLYNKSGNRLLVYPAGKSDTIFSIPVGIEEIGDYAFADVTSLNDIIFSDDLLAIGYNAFNDCKGLTEIILPKRLQSIEIAAFYGCENLDSITITSPICYNISTGSFDGTNENLKVYVPEISLKNYQDNSFYPEVFEVKPVEIYFTLDNDINNKENSDYIFYTEKTVYYTCKGRNTDNSDLSFEMPTDPVKENYIFRGWYDQPNLNYNTGDPKNGRKYTENSVWDKENDAYLYALWEPIEHQI